MYIEKLKKMKYENRALDLDEWDWNRVVYKPAQKKDYRGGHWTIKVLYAYDDETYGPAMIRLGRHRSYGVTPDNLDKDGEVVLDDAGQPKPLTGYKVPIVMTSKRGDDGEATPEELAEVEFLNKFVEFTKEHVASVKGTVGKGGKKEDQVKAIGAEHMFYYAKHKDGPNVGEEDTTRAPTLYTKLRSFKDRKTNKLKVETHFFGPGDVEVDPVTMKDSFYIQPTLNFYDVFVNPGTIKLRSDIWDGTVEPIVKSSGYTRTAPKNTLGKGEVVEHDSGSDDDDNDNNDSEDDVNGDDDNGDDGELLEESDDDL